MSKIKELLFIWVQKIIPQHALSKLVAYFASSTKFKIIFIFLFNKKYKVNLKEALEKDWRKYKTFNDFFTRKLDPSARVIALDQKLLVSPCDGSITSYGQVNSHYSLEQKPSSENNPYLLLEAKKHYYPIETLLAGVDVDKFITGKFITIYLAPHNYHRVHMPIEGTLSKCIYVPGKLFSVNQTTVKNINNLFALNERLIAIFDTPCGSLAIIMVGALIVSGIKTQWDDLCPWKQNPLKLFSFNKNNPQDKLIKINKGDEMGLFKLGSTVILLTEHQAIEFLPNIKENNEIKMGVAMAKISNK